LGRYSTNILKLVQFCLCPRGDNPSSPRLYEAVQHGAIPVFISDMVFQTSVPFQCWVPYSNFTLSVSEDACQRLEKMFVRHRPTVCESCPISQHGQVLDLEEGSLEKYITDADFMFLLSSRRLMQEHMGRFWADADLNPESTKLLRRTGHRANKGLSTNADNCQYKVEGNECSAEGSCCPFRTHSAVMFLSNSGEGGDFYWGLTPDEAKLVRAQNASAEIETQRVVNGTCGRLVGFTSGSENLHGVTPLHSGRQYVLSMTFTSG